MTNIYLITNKITKQKYVGKTIHSIEYRFNQHCTDTNNTYIDSAIRKYGKQNFTVELLKTCEDCEWAMWEAYYIELLHAHWTCGGYNLSRGGDHNPMEDEEVRRRHLVACQSEEHRAKQRQAATGKRHTAASRQKMSVIQKQLYSNPELRKKVQMRQPTRCGVLMLDANGNIVREFDSLNDVCRYFNKPLTNSGRLREFVDAYNKNGKRAKFWGYSWSKVNKV